MSKNKKGIIIMICNIVIMISNFVINKIDTIDDVSYETNTEKAVYYVWRFCKRFDPDFFRSYYAA